MSVLPTPIALREHGGLADAFSAHCLRNDIFMIIFEHNYIL